LKKSQKIPWIVCLLFLPILCQANIDAGPVYGANIFTGLFTGAIVGAGAGSIAYASERHNQDPLPIVYDAVYGSLGTALAIGVPLSAYEVSANKPGVGSNALFDVLGFSMIGGLVGGAAGTLSYKNKVGNNDSQAEDFLAAAGAGICGGAGVGLLIGCYEAFSMDSPGAKRPTGKGIHARLGILSGSTFLANGHGARFLPNVKVLEITF